MLFVNMAVTQQAKHSKMREMAEKPRGRRRRARVCVCVCVWEGSGVAACRGGGGFGGRGGWARGSQDDLAYRSTWILSQENYRKLQDGSRHMYYFAMTETGNSSLAGMLYISV